MSSDDRHDDAAGASERRSRSECTAAPLVDEAVELAQRWACGDRGDVTLRIAEILTRLRTLYRDTDGRPDMRGKSWEYREAVTSIYDRAGLDRVQRDRLSAAVRMRLSTVLREYMRDELGMTDDDFDHYGMNPLSVNERRQSGSERGRRTRLPALKLRNDPAEQLLDATHYARRAIELPPLPTTAAILSATERADILEDLQAIQARADALLRVLAEA